MAERMTDRTTWDRQLWGVIFRGVDRSDMLIGRLWHEQMPTPYDGEPTRPLLFATRQAARDWCTREMEKYKGRSDCCADWRFRPVRVRETVRPV